MFLLLFFGNVNTIASAGSIIFAAVVLHNAFGLLFGYLTARVLGLDESNRRAISIEVGMQNSGLGVALATAHFGPLAALPSVLGAVWHNISGPILATYWSKKPERSEVHHKNRYKKRTAELKCRMIIIQCLQWIYLKKYRNEN